MTEWQQNARRSGRYPTFFINLSIKGVVLSILRKNDVH